MKSLPIRNPAIGAIGVAWLASIAIGAPAAAESVSLAHLAQQGEFEQLLTSLKGEPQVASDPLGASLISNLQGFCAHRADTLQQRQEAYESAMTELDEQAAKEELDEALVKALEAHNLAVDPVAMRSDVRVQALIDRTAETAREAEAEGDWVEAMSLYRAIDLLYDNSSTEHHANLKRALRRVKVLRLYAPRRLYDLAVARAHERNAGKEEEDKEDEIQPYLEEEDTWEARL